MTPTVEEIVKGLSEAQRGWIFATPILQPACAGSIGYWAAWKRHQFDTGHSFAGFARTRQELFHRVSGQNGTWAYRLTPLGLSVRTYLESMGDGK